MELAVELMEADKRILAEDGTLCQLLFCSKEVMVISIEGNDTRLFSPVRIQSCMDPSDVRIEPVKVIFLADQQIRIQDLTGMEVYPQEAVQLKFKNWEPDISNGHCGDCTKCRRCWA